MNRDSLELRSTVTEDGTLRLHLEPVTLPEPGPGHLLVRIEAAPINPSDLGLMFGPADMTTLAKDGAALTARIPGRAMPALRARIGQSLPAGNEGAGTVIAAGPDQQHLVGSRVAMLGGAMYARLRLIAAKDCLPLPDGTSAEAGAALFVNPLTALGFVETMRAEGHTAIVHAPAASNLGQMLVRICKADGIGLVNIVRSPEQVALLRGLGAEHAVDSSAETFREDLTEAIAATGATLSFDAIGGGEMTSTILNAMEAVAARSMASYDRYGSAVLKQGYIYGALDTGPTTLRRGFGFSWSIGGWLLFHALQRLAPATVQAMRQRVVDEMGTTFASSYTARITLEQALEPETVAAYMRKSTGAKYLITP
ncbi:Alcohol dehydrogenase GroES domain protein [Xanthobacter versatilis]|uniref:Alcohol dehydrogenase GroES domain protein n=1 Tax=Xanthobacter autotrophicus (strain ATCC BAA-1158 / Py2) TaxID=78245 RepID=A7ID35_XANP2|nr:Alcohol dehydrogenase GroES domain protein [Xanthobacter autotrophicus Py2]